MIYAADRLWWRKYYEETPEGVEKWTADKWAAEYFGLSHIRVAPGDGLSPRPRVIHSGKNSGFQAIQMAVMHGAKRIILIGYDMQRTAGRSHWHGDHPAGLNNPTNMETWVKYFGPLNEDLKAAGIELINATRETALTFLDCRPLEDLI